MDPADWGQSATKRSEKSLGSGEQRRASEPRFLVIGKVVGAHGVGGELKVQILSDDPHRFGRLEQVYAGLEAHEPVPWMLERFRLHKGRALLKFANCSDRDTAATLRGYLLQVPLD